MTNLKLSVVVEEARRFAMTAIAASALASLAVLPASAQQPAPTAPRPAAPRPPAAAAPKPAPPAAAAPAAPAAPQGQATLPPPPPGMPTLIYTQWNKVCRPNPSTNKQVCSTQKQGATEEGVVIITAALIESEGETKVFQVSVPLPVLLRAGAGISIDKDQPMGAQFLTCVPFGCIAEFEGTADLVGKLKKGQTLNLMAVAMGNNAFSLQMPLTETAGNSFGKSNDGPGMDEKVFAEQQKKLQEELQKRADEARKRLETQGGAPTGAAR
jgi:invasion protein IalB